MQDEDRACLQVCSKMGNGADEILRLSRSNPGRSDPRSALVRGPSQGEMVWRCAVGAVIVEEPRELKVALARNHRLVRSAREE